MINPLQHKKMKRRWPACLLGYSFVVFQFLVLGMDKMTQVDVEIPRTSSLLCSREQVKRGFWTEPNRNASMPYRSTTWEETCYRNGKEYYESKWSVDEPCELTAWDPYLLCEVLENKTLGFLGDSIAWQTFRSMRYLLGAMPTINTKVLEEFQYCATKTKVFWHRNNKLDARGVQVMIDQYKPDIIVANRGAHYDPNDIFFPHFNQTINVFREWVNHSDRFLVWRTTAPGIPQCETFHGPQNSSSSLFAMEQHVESLSWYSTDEPRQNFHWWEIQKQNAFVEELLLKSFGSDLEFLDSYHWYMLQPDLHIGGRKHDCLHYCLPGVPDETSRLLLHVLHRRGTVA